MAISLSLFTSWGVGVINGYKQKEHGLPNNIKYGTIGITSIIPIIKTIANVDKHAMAATTSGQKLFVVFIGVPLLVSSNFCMGHHMGKAIRYTED